MSEAAPRVQRPTLLGLVVAIALLAMFASVGGLLGLREARLAGPIPLVTRTDEVADVLQDSPWISADARGPIVWTMIRPERTCCWDLTPQALIGLSDEDMDLRAIVVAPRPAPEGSQQADAAQLAQDRDWRSLRRWAQGEKLDVAETDPAVAEGYAEWGRASYDRIAAILRANGVEPRLPLVIWRTGPEWRVLVGGPSARLDAVRRELDVGS